MAKAPILTPDRYFALLEEPHKTIAWEVRRYIRDSAPEIEETVKYGVPFYTFKGAVCYLSISPQHGVYLGFPNGTLMSDAFYLFSAHHLKQIRHIQIPDCDFLLEHSTEIQNYITEAMVINELGKR